MEMLGDLPKVMPLGNGRTGIPAKTSTPKPLFDTNSFQECESLKNASMHLGYLKIKACLFMSRAMLHCGVFL